MTFWNAATSMSLSERFPHDFSLSTSIKNFSLPVQSRLFFSANLIARLFSSFLDEYFLGILLSIKLNTCPHFLCPIVGVEGFAEVRM